MNSIIKRLYLLKQCYFKSINKNIYFQFVEEKILKSICLYSLIFINYKYYEHI